MEDLSFGADSIASAEYETLSHDHYKKGHAFVHMVLRMFGSLYIAHKSTGSLAGASTYQFIDIKGSEFATRKGPRRIIVFDGALQSGEESL